MSQASSPRVSGDGVQPPKAPPELDDDDLAGDLGAMTVHDEPVTGGGGGQEASADDLDAPQPSPPPGEDVVLDSPDLPTPVEDPEDDDIGGDIGSGLHTPSPQLGGSPGDSALLSRRQQNVEPLQIQRSSATPSPVSHSNASPARITSPFRSIAGLTSPRSVNSMIPPSPGLLASPRFRTIDVRRSYERDEEDDEVDPSAPFESIPIDAGPAPDATPTKHVSRLSKSSVREAGIPFAEPATPSKLPQAPRSAAASPRPQTPSRVNGKAESINGRSTRTSTSDRSSVSAERVATPVTGASTPRRMAPPAHPHPFPIPSAPLPTNAVVPQVADVPSGPSGAGVSQGLGVKGMSTMDKFISRTRPQHLPPKDKNEDELHLHEWESMMAKAREHEQQQRKHAEAARAERERRLVAITPRWEALLSDREFSSAKVRANPAHRSLWFEGVPSHLRGKAWSLAIGNGLAMHRDAYWAYLRRAQKALTAGRFPPDILEQIEDDLDTTLPTLHVFQRGSPVRDELRDLVSAWVVYRSDEALGYAPYITLLAAMFILVSPPAEAFVSLCNLLARPCLRAFYTDTEDEINAFYRVFENLQADKFPRIFANCKNLGLRLPESYFRSMLVEQVPFDTACRLWDQIVLDGDGYIFRAALAIFGFLEPRLYYPDRDEIESVLEGRNAATIAIQEREKERARLRGERYEDTLDGKLSVFGLHEAALFQWLADDGWRDSRFERLVMRELPD